MTKIVAALAFVALASQVRGQSLPPDLPSLRAQVLRACSIDGPSFTLEPKGIGAQVHYAPSLTAQQLTCAAGLLRAVPGIDGMPAWAASTTPPATVDRCSRTGTAALPATSRSFTGC